MCHLHINFHGCKQSYGFLGTEYVLHTQLNEWAESNGIVVLYPQATANDIKVNPNACFDWWGYNFDSYATKGGAQMATVFAIHTALMRGDVPPAPTVSCDDRAVGATCLGADQYVMCPAGVVGWCLPFTVCEGLPGFAVCV